MACMAAPGGVKLLGIVLYLERKAALL